MITKRPRGTADILPGEIGFWLLLEETARIVCAEYDYHEIRTPIFEHTELFHRGVGDTTDIVEKEMYEFEDKGGRSITLRPEGTAPIVRAYLENKLHAEAQPVKLFYIGPMFRYGRPQMGRLRQFHQFGIEVFGSEDPAVDAEVIALCMDYYRRLGLRDLHLHVNTVGCRECRPVHRSKLQEYLKDYLGELCETCRGRYERNPLRIFDCKSEICAQIVSDAPTPAETLCRECSEHFDAVKDYLSILRIPFIEDPKLVRGIDYYTRTAFEVTVESLGAQSSIGGGGRYDSLVEICGGPDTPGMGFGLGMDRIILSLQAQGVQLPEQRKDSVFVATLSGDQNPGEGKKAFEILAMLRSSGFTADKDYLGRSLKAQMKFAGKRGFRYAAIVGGEELDRGSVVLRDMESGEQKEVPINELVNGLKAATE